MSFGIPAALLFGLVLILASLSLFLTSKFKPDLYQESDNIYAVIGLICGLLLLISLDLGAAMAFQQLLMIGSLITIMWQFIQVRAENKRLKGGVRSAGREASPRKGYTAQIDDVPESAPAKRSNRRNEDGFDRSNNEREDREEFPSRRATRELPANRFAQTAPRRRLTEPERTEVSYLARRQNDSWDEGAAAASGFLAGFSVVCFSSATRRSPMIEGRCYLGEGAAVGALRTSPFFGPLRVRALVWVRWPRAGRPLR